MAKQKDLELIVEIFEELSNNTHNALAAHKNYVAYNSQEILKRAREYGIQNDEAIDLVQVYALNAANKEPVFLLRNATCETMEVLYKTNQNCATAIKLIGTFSDESAYDESATELKFATCKTLEYISHNNLDSTQIINKIENINDEEKKRMRNEHNKIIAEIKENHTGLNRTARYLVEKINFRILNKPSFSAADLYRKACGQHID